MLHATRYAVRMSSNNFLDLIVGIGHKSCKKDTHYREVISVRERLAVTLQILACCG